MFTRLREKKTRKEGKSSFKRKLEEKKSDQICGQYTNTCKLRENCNIVQDFKNHKS
jgi:hypothetical protein